MCAQPAGRRGARPISRARQVANCPPSPAQPRGRSMSYDPARPGGPVKQGGHGDPGARSQGYQAPPGAAPRPAGDGGRAPAASQPEPRAVAAEILGGDSALLAESKEEYDHVGRELDEIRMLVKQ